MYMCNRLVKVRIVQHLNTDLAKGHGSATSLHPRACVGQWGEPQGTIQHSQLYKMQVCGYAVMSTNNLHIQFQDSWLSKLCLSIHLLWVSYFWKCQRSTNSANSNWLIVKTSCTSLFYAMETQLCTLQLHSAWFFTLASQLQGRESEPCLFFQAPGKFK